MKAKDSRIQIRSFRCVTEFICWSFGYGVQQRTLKGVKISVRLTGVLLEAFGQAVWDVGYLFFAKWYS
jgi:hypothetical protein